MVSSMPGVIVQFAPLRKLCTFPAPRRSWAFLIEFAFCQRCPRCRAALFLSGNVGLSCQPIARHSGYIVAIYRRK
jgi:hypothetical protein